MTAPASRQLILSLDQAGLPQLSFKAAANVHAWARRQGREQSTTRKGGRSDRIAAALAAAPPAAARRRLVRGPCCTALLNEPAGSADVVFADPPHDARFEDLAAAASHLLRPGGSLLCISDQYRMAHEMSVLAAAGLLYGWLVCMPAPPREVPTVSVTTSWRPVLLFSQGEAGERPCPRGHACRGKPDWPWFDDVAKSGLPDLLRRFVRPWHTVVDPFGCEESEAAILALGATFVGCT